MSTMYRSTRPAGPFLAARLIALMLGAAAFLMPGAAKAQNPPPPPPPPPEVQPPTTQPPATPPTTTPTTPPPNGQPPPPPEATGPAPATPPSTTPSGGRYLLLPDISMNGIFNGLFSTDRRDRDRDKFRLDEAELAIQSNIYPLVRLETFIVFGEEGAHVEEGFVTFQSVPVFGQHISAVLGRRKVPFGRVNQLHPHSWLYIVQPNVLSQLVSPESLTGDGGYISYLLPTGKVFTQLDLGLWTQSEEAEEIPPLPDSQNEITPTVGTGIAERYGTARLLVATEVGGGSVELGGSVAGGRGVSYSLDEERSVRPNILLSGVDFTYRRAGTGTKRLLIRGEYIQHRQKDGDFQRTTSGWYAFADQRLDPVTSIGVRYDSSQYPYAPGRSSGISLIATRNLTEATYWRMQFIHGSRPGMRNFNEFHIGLVVGAGPHTHNLE